MPSQPVSLCSYKYISCVKRGAVSEWQTNMRFFLVGGGLFLFFEQVCLWERNQKEEVSFWASGPSPASTVVGFVAPHHRAAHQHLPPQKVSKTKSNFSICPIMTFEMGSSWSILFTGNSENVGRQSCRQREAL